MNDSEFEQFLKRRRVPRLPADWRGEVLLRAEGGGRRAEEETRAQAKPWWSAWLWPSPYAWAGVGCAWVVALGMNAMSGLPEGSGASAASAPQPAAVYTTIIEERRLVREFSVEPDGPAAPPPPAPVPSGASYERRRQQQMMEA